jgi:hypothetical protein
MNEKENNTIIEALTINLENQLTLSENCQYSKINEERTKYIISKLENL